MKNGRKRGVAIELAIFALAVVAIFGTVAVSIILNEAKYIKADLAKLDETCERLEYESEVKGRIEHLLEIYEGQNITRPYPDDSRADIKFVIYDYGEWCRIDSWKWKEAK
jgi:hypothetical protein